MKNNKTAIKMEKAKKEFLEELKLSGGLIKLACQRVNMSRSTIYNYMNADPAFKDAVDNVEYAAAAMVESLFMEKVFTEKDKGAMMFYLKCKCGWKETRE